MASINFTDPLFASQWFLVNTGQRGGSSRLDINVLPAWQAGFNGNGIIVAINDDGMDLTHPDLVANIDASKVFDTTRGTTGQGFVGTSSTHGTVVGSVVAMAANSVGGVGIAYKATLVPSLAIGTPAPFSSANLFKANLASHVDVSVNSWGSDPAFSENFSAGGGSEEDMAWGRALTQAATEGRNGLGMVIEVSAGNERGNRADAGLSNFTGNRVTISVGAVDENGVATEYSTPGASLLLTAFGGVASADQSTNTGFGVISADIQGTAGYNKTAGSEGDYAYQNQGTSYSGPMVGAAAALMLQANPGLGFRDVSSILAMTARQTDTSNTSWVTNGSHGWNLGGMHFSRDYGYGLLDVAAAVRLAQSWSLPASTMANWSSAEGAASAAGVIPDDAQRSFSVSASVGTSVRIDRVEFDLNLTANAPSQLKAVITSPSGTTVTLFDRPLNRPLKDGAPDMSVAETAWPGTFTIGSTAFLGESSQGTWTLTLTDLVSGGEARFNSLVVRAWGAAPSANDQYVLTDEFKGTKTLTDADGIDVLNAAAVSRSVTLRLDGVSNLGADATISVASGTVIENAFGGLGSDTLMGNAVGNILRGNGGDDTISGGAGTDTSVYAGASSQYSLSFDRASGALLLTDTQADRDGRDTLQSVERLSFTNRTIITETQAHGSYSDVKELDQIYQFFILAFGAAPGVEYLQQCVDAARGGASVRTITNVFCGKSQFTDYYPTSLSNRELASKLVANVVGSSATVQARADAVNDITGALDNGLSVGNMVYTVFSNLAGKTGDATWGGTAQLFFNQIAVAKFYSEVMNQSTTDRPTLASAIAAVSATSDVSSDAAMVTLIGQGLLGS